MVHSVTSQDDVRLEDYLLPDPARSAAVLRPEGSGPGSWAGGPAAVSSDGEIVLAYRLRRPVGQGRGHSVGIARSADGEHFTTVGVITRDEMDAESLERPALAVTADGTWRLYLSCATRGTKHWRVEVLEASAPHRFDPARRSVVLPGDASRAVKDPVITWHDGRWHMWVCVHPLDDPANTDRMWTDYATSTDGLSWDFHGPALLPRNGQWDARGARLTAALFVPGGVMAYYDGRATAAENFEERTGVAFGTAPGALTAVGTGPAAQSHDGGHGLRYLAVLPLGGGRRRLYYELTVPGGGHELRTELR
jgi:hypothetical protein